MRYKCIQKLLNMQLSRHTTILKYDMIGMSQFILLKELHFLNVINSIIAFSVQKPE